MKIRQVTAGDREAMLVSFKPMFGDWDYLPLVIDDWLAPSPEQETWVACSGPSSETLTAMAQAHELEPGDWYLKGLRSNAAAKPNELASAILGLVRTIRSELKERGAATVRYGTLEYFHESLRLSRMLGFREHFRLGHAFHPIPEVPDSVEGIEVEVPDDESELLDVLTDGSVVREAQGFFFTWWDTRRLRMEYVTEARSHGLLLAATRAGRMIGTAMFWHVPWQDFLVLSIMEGNDDALCALFRGGIESAQRLGCNSIGMVHPSMEEMNRRQQLFNLPVTGSYTVQLIHADQ